MSYNKKAIADALAKLNKARKPKQVNDIIMDPEGQNKFPGLPTRIPSDNITMETTPYPVLGIDNFGNQQMMYPGANYTFPGADYVDEYPMAQYGGLVTGLTNTKGNLLMNSKGKRIMAKSGSLYATNKLFLGNPLVTKRKKAVFVPGHDFQTGGQKPMSREEYEKRKAAYQKVTGKAPAPAPQPQTPPTNQPKPATGLDSLNVYNSAIASQNYFSRPEFGYSRTINDFDRNTMSNYRAEVRDFRNVRGDEQKIRTNTENYKNNPEQLIEKYPKWAEANNMTPEKVRQVGTDAERQLRSANNFNYPVYDLVTGDLDLAAPPVMYDTRIRPQGMALYSGDDTVTPGGIIETPYYDPLAVAPSVILSDADFIKRYETYGTDGLDLDRLKKLVPNAKLPAPPVTPENTPSQAAVKTPIENKEVVSTESGVSESAIPSQGVSKSSEPKPKYHKEFNPYTKRWEPMSPKQKQELDRLNTRGLPAPQDFTPELIEAHVRQSGGATDWRTRIASTLNYQQGGQLSAEEFAKRKAAYEKVTGRKLEQPKTIKPSEKARQATLDKYNQLPVVQSQPSETIQQSRGIDTRREKEIVEAQANTDAKAAENYMHFYNKTYGSDQGAITYEQALQKVRQPNFDKAKYLNMYNLGESKNEQLQSFRKEDQANRTWEVITNPFTAFEYAVTTGDMANMPSNINAARMQGYDVGATPGRNMVGNALNMTTNLFDAGDKVVRNVGEGNLLGAGLEALRFLPGARMTTGLGKQAGKYLKLPGSPNNFNLEELRRVYHNNKRFLSPEELKFLHKKGHGKLSRYQNDDFLMTQEQVDRWEKIRNANRNQLQQPPSEIQFMPDGTTRDIYTQQPISDISNYGGWGTDQWDATVHNTFDLNKLRKPVNKSGLTKEDALSKASVKDKEIIAKMSNTEFENTVLKPNGEIAIYKPGTDVEQMTYDLGNRKLKLKDAKEMSEKEYVDVFNKNLDLLNNIIAKRNKSGIDYKVKELTPDGRLIFSTPEQKIPIKLSTKQKTDIESFNKNPEEFLKNRTGLKKEGTKWKMSDEVGGYVFNSIEEAIDFVKKEMKAFTEPKIISGESVWGIKINPGQWKGAVEDITNTEYFRSIPGLEMSNTTSGVFADHVARRGTGAYESINEYLKKLDLGRVKPGFNSQTKFSRGAWENFIKSGKGVGFYNNPNTVYGTMKSLFPYIGAAGAAASQFQQGGATNSSLPAFQDMELTDEEIEEYKRGGCTIVKL